MKKARRGYTLFEVLRVITLLVLMAAGGMPLLDARETGYRLTSAGHGVADSWAGDAVPVTDDGRQRSFPDVLVPRNIRDAHDAAVCWTGANPPPPPGPAIPPLALEEALPRGVAFTPPDAANQPPSGDTVLP